MRRNVGKSEICIILGSKRNSFVQILQKSFAATIVWGILRIFSQLQEFLRRKLIYIWPNQHRGKTSAHAWGTKKMAMNLNQQIVNKNMAF
jgi:hypothetical protein